ncbi:DnaD domain protein [Brevibacillus marinus]|uniref:DnaD domain protein n=1 Tax=Brevibacillus marinus TaxID=2496837 RepID=UPI000F849EAF|nr:DnaD domain protein [Brevibacillus marinus]
MDRQIVVNALQEGATSISNLLLITYKRLSLTDEEMMLIIHLLSFQQVGNRFPTIQQLENRLSMPSVRLIQLLQKLIKDGWLTIDEEVDQQTGMRYESYNLEPLYKRLAERLREEELAVREAVAGTRESAAASVPYKGLYNQFEQAFGRPLSPFEIETLHIWVEEDKYPEELIISALREAAAVGKLYIRYIDRILLEWQRQQITSAEEARHYSLRFRRHHVPRDQRQPL